MHPARGSPSGTRNGATRCASTAPAPRTGTPGRRPRRSARARSHRACSSSPEWPPAAAAASSWWSSTGFTAFLGTDLDVLFARSRDGGVSWSPPSALNTYAAIDNRPFSTGAHRNDYRPAIDADASGTWVVGYAQSTHCCASDVYYRTVSRPDCPVAPATGCRQTLAPAGAELDISEAVARDDTLSWRWKGEATDPMQFGNPLSTSDWVFCLYDETGGMPALVFEKEIRAGGQCGALDRPKACWRATASGFAYQDSRRSRSAVGRLKLRAGPDGRAKVLLGGRGFAVAPPFLLPLASDSAVRAQLHNLETAACWEGAFTTPMENSSAEYRARSD